MSDEIRKEDWISARRAFMPNMRPSAPATVDKEVSRLVGKTVHTNDPRLVQKVVEWERKKDPEAMGNFLRDPRKVAELKKLFKNG